jgi:hypothetical protein
MVSGCARRARGSRSLLARAAAAAAALLWTDAGDAPRRRDVVELRIHGVGGTPAPDLLGEQSLADVVRVAGEGKSAFFARLTRPRVEGYAWGP